MIFNLLLFLYVLFKAPQMVWRKGKKPSLKERFGWSPPKGGEGRRVWVHAVSVGEVKAAQSLVQLLAEQGMELLITTATVMGREEAERSLPQATHLRIFPLDFSWIMRRWLRAFRPHQLLFIEGDLWPNLLREAKRMGVKTALVSGKISERSLRRFSRIPFFARALFDHLDLLAVQNEQQRNRFAQITDRHIPISGNLKLDMRPQPVDHESVRKRFALRPDQWVITIASTHAPEERELLEALQDIPNLTIFLAPRHPERFEEIAHLLKILRIPYCRWQEQRTEERVILVDTMGQLPFCYAISKLSIVAGSFSSRMGGHNVLEPCLYGCPVLFGPEMFAQQEFAELVLSAHAGAQVSLTELCATIRRELAEPSYHCTQLSLRSGCAQRILEFLIVSIKS